MKPVDILLATCNSEKYLDALLKSLLDQTHREWRLLIHDDGSSDGTPAILRAYVEQHPDKIRLIQDGGIFGSPHGSFSHLAKFAESEYVMFCDHDDIWLPRKIELTLKSMLAAREKHGGDIPLLVHTDLQVVNAGLGVISGSFWKYQNLSPASAGSFNRIMMQNVVTGCTMMVNRKLMGMAIPVPGKAVMHDWWFALCASAFGKIEYIPTPTVLYRQHEFNTVGAKKWDLNYIAVKAVSLWNAGELAKQLDAQIEQLRQFRARYKNLLNTTQAATADCFIDLRNMSYLRKRFIILKHSFFKNGFIRNIGLFTRI